ncbi:MAG TPA: VOC family protein [Candidatus Dormibacteraeota bacterium]|nr:VOC family protein [Candidatus Dormibacteraeota bacterium]
MENISRRTFLAFTAGAVLAPPDWPASLKIAEVPSLLDHILLGCNDLERGMTFVEERSGVRAAFGGVHPGRGTQNALLSLGERRYLEIIAPDPKQAGVEQYSVITKLKEPRLIGWAAHRDDLEQFAAQLRQEAIEFEGPQPGSRQRPDGKVLRWKALRLKDDHRGLLPFFIEWSKDSVHPSVDAPKGCTLARFEATTPGAEDLLHAIARVQLDLYVSATNNPALHATIASPKGQFSVTS